MTINTPCPSASWDAHEAAQEGPEGLCANCLCTLPEEDPDPKNGGDSPWWDGFCSEPCRDGTPVPSDEDLVAALDAYGHLTWTTGYSSEWSEDDDDDRGDWLACFDAVVWKHPSRGVLVAYHVVVNSDSGGFIDTLESGVVEASKAPLRLPDYWSSVGMEHGVQWTEAEIQEAGKCQERWEADLRAEIENLA